MKHPIKLGILTALSLLLCLTLMLFFSACDPNRNEETTPDVTAELSEPTTEEETEPMTTHETDTIVTTEEVTTEEVATEEVTTEEVTTEEVTTEEVTTEEVTTEEITTEEVTTEEVTTEEVTTEEITTEEVTTEEVTTEEVTTEEVTTEEVTTEEITTEEVTTEETTTEEVTTEEVTTEEITTEEVTTEEITTEEVTTEEVTTEEVTTEEITTEEVTTEEITTEEVTTEEITTEEVTTEEVTTEEVVTERVPDGTIPFVPDHPERMTRDWKALWLSQFDLQPIYTSGSSQRAEADFRTRMAQVLDNTLRDGYNTVVLQLRPYADSLYPSAVYPPSRYAIGSYAGQFNYDPIEIIMELCQERGLSVHGWINPMRGMTEAEIQQVDDKYLIKQWYNDPTKKGDYLVFVNKNWYLNIAHPEVRKLICDGAAEILSRYDMDGIHMDDYFYPTTNASFDAKAYDAYKKQGGTQPLAQWRKECLNRLVAELYATVKSHDLRALFGISPAGNINTVMNTHYADVKTWCGTPGYIDYICPQVYFGFEHASWAFDKTCKIWQDIVKTDYVSLIIGMTFGKALSGVDNYAGAAGKDEWTRHKDVMLRSLQYTETLEKCVGVTVFCYQYLWDRSDGSIVPGTREEHEAFSAYLKVATWR